MGKTPCFPWATGVATGCGGLSASFTLGGNEKCPGTGATFLGNRTIWLRGETIPDGGDTLDRNAWDPGDVTDNIVESKGCFF